MWVMCGGPGLQTTAPDLGHGRPPTPQSLTDTHVHIYTHNYTLYNHANSHSRNLKEHTNTGDLQITETKQSLSENGMKEGETMR